MSLNTIRRFLDVLLVLMETVVAPSDLCLLMVWTNSKFIDVQPRVAFLSFAKPVQKCAERVFVLFKKIFF